jgi:hypothetical protein
VICRFRYEDIKVDVMNTKAVGWAPANPWFAPGFARCETIDIEDQHVQILPLPYFLASKFTAFEGRGSQEPRTSHDLEDIIYVFDNRTDIVEQLTAAPEDVKPYLIAQFQNIVSNRQMQEAIFGNLYFETREVRYKRLMNGIRRIVDEG